jgi:hypothetical protein
MFMRAVMVLELNQVRMRGWRRKEKRSSLCERERHNPLNLWWNKVEESQPVPYNQRNANRVDKFLRGMLCSRADQALLPGECDCFIDANVSLWKHYFMKTTIDIPEPLYRKAKMRAVAQRTSLKALVLKALERELLPEQPVPPETPYFARRKLLPEFKKLMENGVLRGGRDSTEMISEDRDREVQ